MSYHPRRMLTPGASRKRKEMEVFYASKPSPKPAQSASAAELVSSNRLLAGYMAYEFLTKGTILGQNYDLARAEAVPLSSASADWKRPKQPRQRSEAEPSSKNNTNSNNVAPATVESYAEVTNLLKTDGAHIPGVVNPTQLGRWIHM